MCADLLNETWTFTRQNEPSTMLHELGCGLVAGFTARSPVKETNNEDAATVIPVNGNRAVLSVADGVGGHQGGAEASSRTLAALIESVRRWTLDDAGLRPAILDGLERANEVVADLRLGAATTVAVAEIDGRQVRPYHVGDSVILIVGQRGKVRFQSLPHSPVGYGVRAGLIEPEDAMHHADRHLVSNVVGMPEMSIDVGPVIGLRPRDTLLIASDGLFDNLHVEEIIDGIRTGPLPTVVERLAESARHRMIEPEPDHPSKPDDLTFLVFRPTR